VVRATWDRFTVGDEAHLEVLAAVCAELADWCDGSAEAIEHAKHQLVGLLVELAFQITVLIALAPGTLGGSLALIQAAEAATRVRAREVVDAATSAVILATRRGTGERVTGLLDALRQRGSTGAPDIGVPPADPGPPLDLGGDRHGDPLPDSGPLPGPPTSPDPVPTRPDPDPTAPAPPVLTGSPSGNPPSGGGPSLPPDPGAPPAPAVPVPGVPGVPPGPTVPGVPGVPPGPTVPGVPGVPPGPTVPGVPPGPPGSTAPGVPSGPPPPGVPPVPPGPVPPGAFPLPGAVPGTVPPSSSGPPAGPGAVPDPGVTPVPVGPPPPGGPAVPPPAAAVPGESRPPVPVPVLLPGLGRRKPARPEPVPESRPDPEPEFVDPGYLARAAKVEQALTPVLHDVAEEACGWLWGLAYRRKSVDAIGRKLAGQLRDSPDLTMAEALAALPDAVRYTIGLPDDDYAAGVERAVDALTGRGYRRVRLVNSWDCPDRYPGIVTWCAEPGTGQLFEVQLHTEGSYAVRTGALELAYQQILLMADGPEQDALLEQLRAALSEVVVPDGATGIRG
jgi:hypothetical protein